MIASQIWKVTPLRIKVIFWISVLKLKKDRRTSAAFLNRKSIFKKDTIRHHHFIDRAKRQNSLHDSITVFGNEESNKMQSIKCNFWTFISLFFWGGGGGGLPVFNRLFHAGFSRVDKDQLAKSVYTAGKSATEFVNLLSLKVIQLKGAEK